MLNEKHHDQQNGRQQDTTPVFNELQLNREMENTTSNYDARLNVTNGYTSGTKCYEGEKVKSLLLAMRTR